MARSTASDSLVSTFPLVFSFTPTDNKALTFLIPNPVAATAFEKNPTACEVSAIQLIFPVDLTGVIAPVTATPYSIGMLVTFDTAVTYKNAVSDGTSTQVMWQNLISSPTCLGWKRKLFAQEMLTSGMALYPNLWDSDQWLIEFGNPRDTKDGQLWVTQNGVLTLAPQMTNFTGNGNIIAYMKMFWRPKKLSLAKYLEMQAAQSRNLVVTVT